MHNEDRPRAELIAELRELRQQVDALTISNVDLETYVRIVTHDLKHPLSIIIGYAEFLLEMYETDLGEEVKRDLEVIARRGHTMVNIVEEMLALIYVRGADDLVLKPLDMGAIVHRAQQRMRDVIERLDAEIVIPTFWPSATGRDFLLEEIWANLFGYALRYDSEPRQSRVMLGASCLDSGMVCFWIRDNAHPLSEEEQALLLVSLPEFRCIKTQGKHFGLPLVRYIVEKLGGEVGINCEPEPGWGNEFFFTLPGAKAQ